MDKEILNKVTQGATGSGLIDKKLAVYSPSSAIALEYMLRTIPDFSKGGCAAELLSVATKNKYKGLFKSVSKFVPDQPRRSKVSYCPTSQIQIDESKLKEVKDGIKNRSQSVIGIFNPRVAAVFNYLTLTKTKFSVSHVACEMLEKELIAKYPELMKRIKIMLESEPANIKMRGANRKSAVDV